jgi:isocitrate dehydrogenase kinase/phosphatase
MGMEGLPSSRPGSRRPGQAIAAVPPVRAEPTTERDSAAARAIAAVLIEGFDKHHRLFRAASTQAKRHFEEGSWAEAQQAVRERIIFYDDRVAECVERVRAEFDVESLELAIWREAKLFYIGLLVEHSQPELAETFFNSVITRILRRTYSDNDLIFVRAAMSTEYIDSDPPIYRSYYPNDGSLRECFEQLFLDFGWNRPFADLGRDLSHLLRALDEHRAPAWAHLEPNHQIQVLSSAFYRNKAAYVVGKIINGYEEIPFVVPVLNDAGRLSLDAIVLREDQLNVLFSLSRAYFMVDMAVPSGYVKFLRRMMPTKTRSELYTMLGLGKQGKTLFCRDLRQHLLHSKDVFVEAPGIQGQVMLVFTLPSYPYVFKVIKDVFGPGKDTDRETVESKFALVKHVDRVGRMADTLEFTDLALPRSRFSAELLLELDALAPSMVEDGDPLVIRHCYVERRMVPLNIYLDRAAPTELESAVRDYGNAIRDLAIANIFPGDMLWRNFGVTRHDRVVFYDYDEIEYLTDVNFRRIPPPPNPEAEFDAEPWYSVARDDVFPEEFATFLLGDPRLRELFLRHHAELLEPEFWAACQRRIEAGEIVDFFPYPDTLRFCNHPAE